MWEISGEVTPPEVAIDEAVRLAKRYSTDEAGAFVNGVLGGIVRGDQSDPDVGGEQAEEDAGGEQAGAPGADAGPVETPTGDEEGEDG